MRVLGDLCPPLVVSCAPCKRRGRYPTCRLLQRFRPHTPLVEVCRELTADCRWQRSPGSRAGNQYVPRCMAVVEPPESLRPRHDTSLTSGAERFWAVDEWLPDRFTLAQQLAHVTRNGLANEVYDAAVRLDPHGLITLSQGMRVLRKSYDDAPNDYPGHGPKDGA